MPEVISLGIGEPDFATDISISEAGFESARRGITQYTANSGLMDLRVAISEQIEKLYGVKCDPATEIIVTVGVSE